ncbi:MAG: hypothetical protein ACLU9S_12020 [Oscillospiraceae bacterium]
MCVLLTVLGTALFLVAGEPLVRLYLKGEGKAQDADLFLGYGMDYLKVMLFGLLPFAPGQRLFRHASGDGADLGSHGGGHWSGVGESGSELC